MRWAPSGRPATGGPRRSTWTPHPATADRGRARHARAAHRPRAGRPPPQSAADRGENQASGSGPRSQTQGMTRSANRTIPVLLWTVRTAKVAELADAPDLGSG